MLAEEGVVVHGDLNVCRVRDGLPDGQKVRGEHRCSPSLLLPCRLHDQTACAFDYLDVTECGHCELKQLILL